MYVYPVMQTQPTANSRRYLNREQLEKVMSRCDVWYLVYPNAVHQLIADRKENEIFGLSVLPAGQVFQKSLSEMQELLRAFEYQQTDFQQAHVVVVDPRYTFVPDALFEPRNAETYLHIIHPEAKWHTVHYERIAAMQMVNVYELGDLFFGAARLLFPGANFHHYAGMIAEAVLKGDTGHSNERIYVHLHDMGMDVIHGKDGKLTYHNYFPFEADTDIVYFLLSVAEVLQFKGDQWEVMLCGNVSSDNSLISLMKKYIPEVLLFKRPSQIGIPHSFREVPDHQYFIETACLLCAS